MASALMSDVAIHPGAVIDHVSKSFEVDGRRVEALRDVSLNVETGEFVTLLGPSGCGKSTLLRLLAGLDSPDVGELLVDGRHVAKPSITRGVVFQDHRLLPWLTVSENVGLSLHTVAESRVKKADRVKELLELVGLSAFSQAKPHQLSGGMSQRAAIARALAPRPRLLLLDEPLGALDSLTRNRLQNEILDLWKQESITIVMVTHDVEEAVFLSNRVVVMDPSPGRVRRIFRVDLPHPRRRTDASFVALRQTILDVLEDDPRKK